MRRTTPIRDWNLLSDDLQLALSSAALLRAVDSVAAQAELLAGEMDLGLLADRGGADALRAAGRGCAGGGARRGGGGRHGLRV